MDSPNLLDLPKKARSRIYLLLFVEGTPIEPTKASPRYVPGLLQTCHQLRAEALPVFFANAQFKVTIKNKKGGVAWKWIMSLYKQAAATITHLELHIKTDWNTSGFTLDLRALQEHGKVNNQRFKELAIDPSNKRDAYIRIISAIHDRGIRPAAIEWTTKSMTFDDCLGGGLNFMQMDDSFMEKYYRERVVQMTEQLQLLMVFGEMVGKPTTAGEESTGIAGDILGPVASISPDSDEDKALRAEKLKEVEVLRNAIRKLDLGRSIHVARSAVESHEEDVD